MICQHAQLLRTIVHHALLDLRPMLSKTAVLFSMSVLVMVPRLNASKVAAREDKSMQA